VSAHKCIDLVGWTVYPDHGPPRAAWSCSCGRRGDGYPALVDASRAALAHLLRGRDEEIRAMAAEGASLRAIAAAAGLSHSGVRKIVNRG